MGLDELYPALSEAIGIAEALAASRSADAASSYRRVCDLEAAAAELAPPHSIEAELAQRGAVRAALLSGDPRRAEELFGLYRQMAFSGQSFSEAIAELFPQEVFASPAAPTNESPPTRKARLPRPSSSVEPSARIPVGDRSAAAGLADMLSQTGRPKSR